MIFLLMKIHIVFPQFLEKKIEGKVVMSKDLITGFMDEGKDSLENPLLMLKMIWCQVPQLEHSVGTLFNLSLKMTLCSIWKLKGHP